MSENRDFSQSDNPVSYDSFVVTQESMEEIDSDMADIVVRVSSGRFNEQDLANLEFIRYGANNYLREYGTRIPQFPSSYVSVSDIIDLYQESSRMLQEYERTGRVSLPSEQEIENTRVRHDRHEARRNALMSQRRARQTRDLLNFNARIARRQAPRARIAMGAGSVVSPLGAPLIGIGRDSPAAEPERIIVNSALPPRIPSPVVMAGPGGQGIGPGGGVRYFRRGEMRARAGQRINFN